MSHAPPSEAYLEDSICRRLRDIRIRKHAEHVRAGGGTWHSPYTQVALAKRLGVRYTTVWRWENDVGYNPRSLARFDRWARLLGTSFADELLAVIGEKIAE